MGLMLITVGDSSTMEVSKEDIQKYLSYIRGQRHFLADPMLMEMNEWKEIHKNVFQTLMALTNSGEYGILICLSIFLLFQSFFNNS